MNIGGLLTRSFGTGTTAFNQGQADALARMRERQAFVDEEEARRRRAETEALAKGAIRKDYSVPFPDMPGAGIRAFTPTAPAAAPAPAGVVPATPAAGVAPAGVAPAATPAATPAAARAKTIAQELEDPAVRRSMQDSYRGNIAQVDTRINAINAEIAKLLKPKQVPGARPGTFEPAATAGRSPITFKLTALRKELADAQALRNTFVAGLNKSMTAPAAPAAGTGVAAAPAAPAAPPAIVSNEQFMQLAQAVMQAESRGDPNAVSPKGAVGRMQVMPATLQNPGYGIAPARDNSDAENVRVGTQYLDAMLKEFNGNTTYALAAYNWGPDNTKKWIANGANFADLPKETQDYISRVTGSTPTATTTKLGAVTTPASNTVLPPVEQANISDYRNAVPRVDFKLRMKLDERAELQRQADEAQSRDLPELYTQAVSQLRQLDMELIHLQGMVGLGDLVDDPEATQRLSLVRSYYMGQKEGYYKLMPRTDGKYNEVVNGKLRRQGLSLQEVIDTNRMLFDEAYAAAVNATRAKQAEAAIELSSETQKMLFEYGLKNAEAMTKAELDRELENIKGAWSFSQAMRVASIPKEKEVKYIKATLNGEEVTIADRADGYFILSPSEGPSGPDYSRLYWKPLANKIS